MYREPMVLFTSLFLAIWETGRGSHPPEVPILGWAASASGKAYATGYELDKGFHCFYMYGQGKFLTLAFNFSVHTPSRHHITSAHLIPESHFGIMKT